MPRGPWPDAEGALHRVMVPGIETWKILQSNEDRSTHPRTIPLVPGVPLVRPAEALEQNLESYAAGPESVVIPTVLKITGKPGGALGDFTRDFRGMFS